MSRLKALEVKIGREHNMAGGRAQFRGRCRMQPTEMLQEERPLEWPYAAAWRQLRHLICAKQGEKWREEEEAVAYYLR